MKICMLLLISLCAFADIQSEEVQIFDVEFLRRPQTPIRLPLFPYIAGSIDRIAWRFEKTFISECFPVIEDEGNMTFEFEGAIIDLDVTKRWSPECELRFDGQLHFRGPKTSVNCVRELLDTLRHENFRHSTFEIALVPIESLTAAVPGWKIPSTSPWLGDKQFRDVLRHAGSKASYSSVPFLSGEEWSVRPREICTALIDYDVTQTGVIPVIDAVLGGFPGGFMMRGRVDRGPSGEWFRADYEIVRYRAHEGETRKTPDGDLELVDRSSAGIVSSCLLPLNRATVAGILQGDGGYATILRVREGPQGHDDAAGERLRTIDLNSLIRKARDHRLEARSYCYSGGVENLVIGIKLLEASVGLLEEIDATFKMERELLPAVSMEKVWAVYNRSLILRSSLKAKQKVAQHLDRSALALHQAIAIEVAELEWTAEDFDRFSDDELRVDVAALLDSKKVRRRARVLALNGWAASFGATRVKSFVADIEKVSGGTGDVIAEEGDFDLQFVGEGWVVMVSTELMPDGRFARLTLTGESAEAPNFNRSIRSSIRSTLQATKPGVPVKRSADETITIELPEEDATPWKAEMLMPLGEFTILASVPHPKKPGVSRVLVAAVREIKLPQAATK